MSQPPIVTKLILMKSITELRKKTGMSQQDLADYLGISRSLVAMVERGERDLPKEAFHKLQEMNKFIGSIESGKPSTSPNFYNEATKELKKYQQQKIEEYLYKAEGLRRRLATMLDVYKQADTKLNLVQKLTKNHTRERKEKSREKWTEFHEWKSNEKISKSVSAIRMLSCELEAMEGYAAVHEKILKKIP